MPIYLDEEMVAGDPNEIRYPHLLLCMGVTVLLSDGSLIGAHFTNPSTEKGLIDEMKKQIAEYSAKHSVTMRKLYCAGNLPEHTVKYGGMDVLGKAQSLGFHGDAYSFDTSSIKPKDGTYVAVRSNGPMLQCSIYYKRDEKARKAYQFGQGPKVAKYLREVRDDRDPSLILRPGKVVNLPSHTTGLSRDIHKLHEVDFALQIQHHLIP